MKNQKKLGKFLKFFTYIIVLLVVYLLQTNPILLQINSVKPNILLAVSIAIAMHEGEFVGGLLGTFAGMLCDLGSYNVFGFNTLYMLFSSTVVGLLVIYYMKNSKTNALLLTTISLLVRGVLEFFFVFVLWNYDSVELILLNHILPVAVYSALFSVPAHMLIGKISESFKAKYNE